MHIRGATLIKPRLERGFALGLANGKISGMGSAQSGSPIQLWNPFIFAVRAVLSAFCPAGSCSAL